MTLSNLESQAASRCEVVLPSGKLSHDSVAVWTVLQASALLVLGECVVLLDVEGSALALLAFGAPSGSSALCSSSDTASMGIVFCFCCCGGWLA